MKKLALTLMIAMVTAISSFANTKLSETIITFKVNGNATCKESIEALLNGVHGIKSLTWDAETKKATVTYNPEEIKEDLIYVYFAEAGYDSERLRSKQKNYDALSEECKYQRDPERD